MSVQLTIVLMETNVTRSVSYGIGNSSELFMNGLWWDTRRAQSEYLETFIVTWQNIFMSVESNIIFYIFDYILLL